MNQSLFDYAKAQGATGAKLLNAGNGAFIAMSKLPKGDVNRFTIEDKTQMTIPVGKRSGKSGITDLSQFNVQISTAEWVKEHGGQVGVAIATVNSVEELATAEF